MTNYIQVGDHKEEIDPNILITIHSSDYVMVGNGDIFDLCFTPEEIKQHGIVIFLGKTKIVVRNKHDNTES